MSSSSSALTEVDLLFPVSAFSYKDVGGPITEQTGNKALDTASNSAEKPAGPSTQEIEQMLAHARVEASAETERRLRAEFNTKLAETEAKTQQVVDLFQVEQKSYFTRVESEIVHLALAIAGRILHREAQVDPMLVSGIVRVALDKLQSGSNVSVRVSPAKAKPWREYVAGMNNGLNVSVVEDTQMGEGDCVLETELGSADFSIEAQLKEVEQGFCDLLAVRPQG